MSSFALMYLILYYFYSALWSLCPTLPTSYCPIRSLSPAGLTSVSISKKEGSDDNWVNGKCTGFYVSCAGWSLLKHNIQQILSFCWSKSLDQLVGEIYSVININSETMGLLYSSVWIIQCFGSRFLFLYFTYNALLCGSI